MAGHMITRWFETHGADVVTFARQDASVLFDISVPTTHKHLQACKSCDYVINCTGLLIEASNSSPTDAFLVNSWFPHWLCTLVSDSSTQLVHLSTDCVFDGYSGPYTERCIPTETSVYGRSKAFGEVQTSKHITFRTSIIGPEVRSNATGLFDWFLNKSGDTVIGYTDALWNGITTLELAKQLWQWCNTPTVSGLFHLTRNASLTKFEVLTEINRVWGLNKTVQPGRAPKPVNKTLLNSRPEVFEISPFSNQLQDLKTWMLQETSLNNACHQL
jgi:dTDP-4-dehydrorhamnose reductase